MNESIIEKSELAKYTKIYGEQFVLYFISKYKKSDLEFGKYNPDTFIQIYTNKKIMELCDEIKFEPVKLVMLELSNIDINLLEKNCNIINKTINYLHTNNHILIKTILSSSNNCELFCKFLLKINPFLLELDSKNIYNVYLKNKLYLDQVIDTIDKENINIFFSLNKIYNYNIKTLNEILYCKNTRKKIILNQINNCENPEEIKDEITSCFFYINFELFNTLINDIKNISTKYSLPKELLEKINFVYKINDIESNDALIDYVNKLDDYVYIINDCEKITKQYACKDIASSLTIFNNINNKVYLEGQPFKLLVHKIAGYTNNIYQKEIIEDISLWDKNYSELSGISTTLISEDNLGLVRGEVPIIGFNNVDSSLIVDMGNDDIYFTTIREDRNYYARYMTAEDLIYNTCDLYNEIVLKRYENYNPIKPDFTFSYDDINKKDSEISSYFGIPNYILKVDIYAKMMNNKIHYYLEQGDIKNFTRLAYNLCTSFCFKPEIMDLYLRSDQLYKYSKKIIQMYIDGKIDKPEKDIIMDLNYMLNKLRKILMIQPIYGYYNSTYFDSSAIIELKQKIKTKK